MIDNNIFNNLFVVPILNLLVTFFKFFLYIKAPGALGFAIIALVGLVRLVFHPFFKQQMETAHKMQQLKPHLDHISKKHKADPKKLQQEQMRLYQEAGINPAAGCVFMIIQIPIFIALYRTLSLFFVHDAKVNIVTELNKHLYWPVLKIQTIDPWFLGFNLAVTPANGGRWYYYAIPLITGVLQYLQVVTSTPPAAKAIEKKTEGKDEKKDTSGDFQKAMNTQMKYVFPLMIGYFSYTLPIGLSLYWNVFSLFSIIQNKRINPNLKLNLTTKLDEKETK
ncbi:MAG: rane protein insertase YidC 2 [Candidatus Parcubacteria bacterium]|jgi:YidC/Oxa1 family membrane protein insertase